MFALPKQFRLDEEYRCSSSAQPLPDQFISISEFLKPEKVVFVNLREEPFYVEFEGKIYSEEGFCKRLGFDYLHIPILDHSFPKPTEIAKFYTLPKNDWIHFHCNAGKGRSTIAMCIYEMIRGTERSFEEILNKQVELGGTPIKQRAQEYTMFNLYKYSLYVYRYLKLKDLYHQLYLG